MTAHVLMIHMWHAVIAECKCFDIFLTFGKETSKCWEETVLLLKIKKTGYTFFKENQQVGKCAVYHLKISILYITQRSLWYMLHNKKSKAFNCCKEKCCHKITSYFTIQTIISEYRHIAAEERLFSFHMIKHKHAF